MSQDAGGSGRRGLYPPIEPFESGLLDVGDGHQVYWERCGDPRGAAWLFPDLWERFLAPIPQAEQVDLVAAYRRRLTGDDEAARLEAAKAWSLWEAGTITLLPNDLAALFGEPHYALAFARIENHY